MAKFIKSMPKLTNSEVKSLLNDLSTPEKITDEEKTLIHKVRELKRLVGSPIKIKG